MKKKMTAVFAVFLTLTLTISQAVSAFAETGENLLFSQDSSKADTTSEISEQQEDDDTTFKDGSYIISAETDQRMFYIVSDGNDGRIAKLTVKNGQMTAAFSLTGTGYDKAYMGKAEDAASADASQISGYTVQNGYYTYTVPVSALDQQLEIAMHAVKSGKWFQHTIIFYSSKEAKERIEKEQNQGQKTDSDNNTNNSGTANSGSGSDKNNGGSSKPGSGSQKPSGTKENSTTSGNASGNKDNSKNNSKTQSGLADGTYTPDQFSWSGGSGRLAYIACDKITVKKGKAYATIRFSSSSYDKVQAGGGTYASTGSAESTFTIPVTLNTNNTISARTVAMSSPHWIDYTIYPYLAEAGKGNGGVTKTIGQKTREKNTKDKDKNKDGQESVSEIIGLGEAEEIPLEYAQYCRLYRYADGIKLLQIDLTTDSNLSYEEKAMEAQTEVEYDEEGKPIAKSQSEITQALYQNSTVSYLLVPEGAEVPAGLDKEMILISIPADKTWSASKAARRFLQALDCEDMLTADASESENPAAPDFKSIVQDENNLAILPLQSQTQMETLEKRFATLNIPVILDRSADEKTLQAKAEWAKVYAALYSADEQAEAAFTTMQDEAFWDSLAAENSGTKGDADPGASAEAEKQNNENHADALLYTVIVAVLLLLAVAAGIVLKKKETKKGSHR